MSEYQKRALAPIDRNLAGIFFFIYMIAAWSFGLFPTSIIEGIVDNLTVNTVVSESMIIIPALLIMGIWIIIREHRKNTVEDYEPISLADRFMFREIKVSTLLMTLLYVAAITPIIILSNAISLIFVDNTMLDMSSDILSLPVIPSVFFSAVIPAFIEEFAYRGLVYGGFRKDCRPLGATIISALLFGLMHLNFNQFCYTFIIGITLALLTEAAGSIWPAIMVHFIINARSVIEMFVTEHFNNGFFEEYLENEDFLSESMYPVIPIYAVISVFCIIIAGAIISWIAKNEGRYNPLRLILANREYERTRRSVWTFPLIIGVISAVIYILLIELSGL